jgi:hypothetical protein
VFERQGIAEIASTVNAREINSDSFRIVPTRDRPATVSRPRNVRSGFNDRGIALDQARSARDPRIEPESSDDDEPCISARSGRSTRGGLPKGLALVSHDRHFAAIDEALLKRRLAACLMASSVDGEHDPLRLANSAVRRMRQESGQKLPALDAVAVFRPRPA